MTSTTTIAETLSGSGAPEEVVSALERLRQQLELIAKDNLVALLVYGGLARKRFRPDKSDVNVLVVLRDAGTERLAEIAPTFREAWQQARVEPLLLTQNEMEEAADVFPTKFLHIQQYHLMLVGEDPFANLQINHKFLQMRVEQELRNLALRLRRRYLSICDEPGRMQVTLAEIVPPLSATLYSLLVLSKKSPSHDGSSQAILQAAAEAFQLDAQALESAASLRRDIESGIDVGSVYGKVMTSIEKAADVANSMEDPS
jgi:hypothetical protein